MSVVASIVPSMAQLNTLAKFGVVEVPKTKAEASALIQAAIAARDMRPASVPSLGKLGALGGRDLPGAGQREVSTAIALLECVVMLDNGGETAVWTEEIIKRVRERLCKTISITPPHSSVSESDF